MGGRTVTVDEWKAEGELRFGVDQLGWRFICPSCGHVAAAADWRAKGAPAGAVAFSCVGRYDSVEVAHLGAKKGPCNYTGGGLFKLNPVRVVLPDGTSMDVFEFAEAA